jgi:hypothetical protein
MGKLAHSSKSRKDDGKAKGSSTHAAIDLDELALCVKELCDCPAMDVAVPLDAFRALLSTMPCVVCKQWTALAWSRWAHRESDITQEEWYRELQPALTRVSEAAVDYAMTGMTSCFRMLLGFHVRACGSLAVRPGYWVPSG